jgi:hypothetical protein
VKLLSPVEEAYLSGTRDFTKTHQRYICYRLKKKLRLLDEQSRDAEAAMLLRVDNNSSDGGGAARSVVRISRRDSLDNDDNDKEEGRARRASVPRPAVLFADALLVVP